MEPRSSPTTTLKSSPDPSVIRWIEGLNEHQVYLPVFVVGELHKGLGLLPQGKTRQALGVWLDQLEERFSSSIWGQLSAELQLTGKPLPAVDLMVAALALRHHAILATRNIAHFEPTGVELVNPWD